MENLCSLEHNSLGSSHETPNPIPLLLNSNTRPDDIIVVYKREIVAYFSKHREAIQRIPLSVSKN